MATAGDVSYFEMPCGAHMRVNQGCMADAPPTAAPPEYEHCCPRGRRARPARCCRHAVAHRRRGRTLRQTGEPWPPHRTARTARPSPTTSSSSPRPACSGTTLEARHTGSQAKSLAVQRCEAYASALAASSPDPVSGVGFARKTSPALAGAAEDPETAEEAERPPVRLSSLNLRLLKSTVRSCSAGSCNKPADLEHGYLRLGPYQRCCDMNAANGSLPSSWWALWYSEHSTLSHPPFRIVHPEGRRPSSSLSPENLPPEDSPHTTAVRGLCL